jgi:hypothetical protein
MTFGICMMCRTQHHPGEACDPMMAAYIAHKRAEGMREVLDSLKARATPTRRRLTADEQDDETYRQEGWEMGIGGWY